MHDTDICEKIDKMNIIKRICLTLCLLSLVSVIKAQNDIRSWYQLLNENDDKSAVIEEWHTTFEFEKQANQKMPKVIKTDVCRIIPLVGRQLSRAYFVNSHKAIQKYKVLSSKGNRRVKPIIGDQKDPDIFQSDGQYYFFSLNVTEKDQFVEFKVVTIFDDIRFCTREVIPDNQFFVKKRKLTIKKPAWLNLNIRSYNFDQVKVCKLDSLSTSGDHVFKYEFDHLSSPLQCDYSPSALHEFPHLFFIAEAYEKEENKWEPILKTTQDLYSWYKEMLGNSDLNSKSFEAVLPGILKNKKTKQDSVRSIFYWVQDNIRYIAFEKGIDGFRPQSADMVFKNKYGDCKGMANLLKAMLTAAGFDARLTWLGTRDLPYTYATSSIAVDNHMICTWIDKENKVFLDATERYVCFGDCGERIQSKEVLIEDGESFIIDTIKADGMLANCKEYNLKLRLNEKSLNGEMRVEYKEESQRRFFQFMAMQKVEDQEKTIVSLLNNGLQCEIDSIQPLPIKFQRDSNLQIQSRVLKSNALLKVGKEVYLGISDLTPYFNPYIDTLKCNKLYFNETINENVKVDFEIPEGFKLKVLPKPIEVQLNDISFKAGFGSDSGVVRYTSQLQIPNRIMTRDELSDLLDLLKQQKKYRSQKIVFETKL